MDFNFDEDSEAEKLDKIIKEFRSAQMRVNSQADQLSAKYEETVDKLTELNGVLAKRVKELEKENEGLKEEIRKMKE